AFFVNADVRMRLEETGQHPTARNVDDLGVTRHVDTAADRLDLAVPDDDGSVLDRVGRLAVRRGDGQHAAAGQGKGRGHERADSLLSSRWDVVTVKPSSVQAYFYPPGTSCRGGGGPRVDWRTAEPIGFSWSMSSGS